MFKKLTALFLALLMVAGLVACGGTEDPTEPEATDPAPTEPEVVLTIDPITSLDLNLSEAGQPMKMLSAMVNEDGSVYVQLVGQITKKGTISAESVTAITYALEKSGLLELNGTDTYEEGENIATAYAVYGEDNYLSFNYYGSNIPAEFIAAYEAIETCFEELTAEMAEYIPTPKVEGEIAEGDMLAINEIVAGLNFYDLESYTIVNVPLDDAEGFTFNAGLSSADGIESAIRFAPQMITTPYSLVIVTLADAATADAVAQDFENNIDWFRWICTNPTNAAVAVKDNQVLCLIGGDDLYTQSITAIGEAGWEPVATLENPNL